MKFSTTVLLGLVAVVYGAPAPSSDHGCPGSTAKCDEWCKSEATTVCPNSSKTVLRPVSGACTYIDLICTCKYEKTCADM